MSEEDQDSKVHEATPKKIEDARRRGETPASQEFVAAVVFFAFLISLAFFGLNAVSRAGSGLATFLTGEERYFHGGILVGSAVFHAFVQAGAAALVPLISLSLAAGILGYVVQGTVTFAGEKLRPKARRISPIQGAKQKFGAEGFFNFAKSFGKLSVYCAILAIVLVQSADTIIHSSSFGVELALTEAVRLVASFVFAAAIVMLAFGIIDLVWQRASFLKRQRMTQNELKDQMKESEGDPMLKGARRQRARELAATGNLSDVVSADVVIVNPTHYAVALKWDRGAKSAPVCVAKGTDLIAARIRELAGGNSVPIRSDPPTARMIFSTVAVGEQIRPEHFRAVASAIRFADALRKKSGKKS